MNKTFLIAIFILSLSIPSYAQFIGIKIGVPSLYLNRVGGSGGSVVPNHAMTFNSQVMTFNGKTMTFTHS